MAGADITSNMDRQSMEKARFGRSRANFSRRMNFKMFGHAALAQRPLA
jgi:hypothetical protein